MAIVFHCIAAGCGRRVKAPDGSEGKKSRCPHCQTSQRVPVVKAVVPPPNPAKKPIDVGIDLTPAAEPEPMRSSKIKGLNYASDAKPATSGEQGYQAHRQVIAAWMTPAKASPAPARHEDPKDDTLDCYSLGEVSDNPTHERLPRQSSPTLERPGKKK